VRNNFHHLTDANLWRLTR